MRKAGLDLEFCHFSVRISACTEFQLQSHLFVLSLRLLEPPCRPLPSSSLQTRLRMSRR